MAHVILLGQGGGLGYSLVFQERFCLKLIEDDEIKARESPTLYDMVLAFLPSNTMDSLDPVRLLLELLKDIVEIFFCF